MDIVDKTFEKIKENYTVRFMVTQYHIHKGETIYRTTKEETKLGDMSNEYVKQKIIDVYRWPDSDFSDGWIHIFNLELNKRRSLKLQRIKSNIK